MSRAVLCCVALRCAVRADAGTDSHPEPPFLLSGVGAAEAAPDSPLSQLEMSAALHNLAGLQVSTTQYYTVLYRYLSPVCQLSVS